MVNKIVIDSSADLQRLEGIGLTSVPLKILVGEHEYVDDASTDVPALAKFMREYTGKASTTCPSVGAYLEAFEDAENVYCITITSNLSGSYNAASVAAQTFAEQYPERNIHVFDSLTAGPEMALLAEKIRDLVNEGLPFDEVVAHSCEYLNTTRLVFSLESLHNLANNGRVPGAVAKVAGILGIRLLGRASDVGTLQPIGKARGEKKVAPELMKLMTGLGYSGGKVRIDHCCNLSAAETLRQLVQEKFPSAPVAIGVTGALCGFYAEYGGLLVGFETVL